MANEEVEIVYEHCETCGHEQKGSDPDHDTCEQCGEPVDPD